MGPKDQKTIRSEDRPNDADPDALASAATQDVKPDVKDILPLESKPGQRKRKHLALSDPPEDAQGLEQT